MNFRPRHVSEEYFKVMQDRVRGGLSNKGGGERQAGSNPAPSPYNPFPIIIALTGQLVSGKNRVRIRRDGHHYPEKSFVNWRAKAYVQILEQHPRPLRIKRQMRLTCDYWPGDAMTRDVSGQLDALFHLLVYSKVIKDDGLIFDVIWRRQSMNEQFPKVVMELDGY